VSDTRSGGALFSIYVVRADGSGRRLRVPAPATDPDWTSDGRLTYTKSSYNGPTPTRIFISDGRAPTYPGGDRAGTPVVSRQTGRVAEVINSQLATRNEQLATRLPQD
jgi:hypothetical protein